MRDAVGTPCIVGQVDLHFSGSAKEIFHHDALPARLFAPRHACRCSRRHLYFGGDQDFYGFSRSLCVGTGYVLLWLLLKNQRTRGSKLLGCRYSHGISSSYFDYFDYFDAGYFTFAECPGLVMPTIGIEINQTYTFLQEDISNWYHPMGFAYIPDGEHNGNEELEPYISLTGSTCVADLSCPTPRYFRGTQYLGEIGTKDFGLGESSQMRRWFHPSEQWCSCDIPGSHT